MKLTSFLHNNDICTGRHRFLLTKNRRPICLTKKEASIIACLMNGLRAKQIAMQLDASVHTINTQLATLKNKLNCTSIFELGLFLGSINLDLDLQ